jgi:hypothetical protein
VGVPDTVLVGLPVDVPLAVMLAVSVVAAELDADGVPAMLLVEVCDPVVVPEPEDVLLLVDELDVVPVELPVGVPDDVKEPEEVRVAVADPDDVRDLVAVPDSVLDDVDVDEPVDEDVEV